VLSLSKQNHGWPRNCGAWSKTAPSD